MWNSNTSRVILTGGWTLGHIVPLVSFYMTLKDGNTIDFLWLGERNSFEEETAERYNIPFVDISAGKIRRYWDIRNFYEPLKNLSGIMQALWTIWRYKPDYIFSKGWFVTVPVSIAAFLSRTPLYVHESDNHMWLANKIGSKFAKKVFFTFPNELIDNSKYFLSGPIRNPEMLDYLESAIPNENEKLEVLVIAGSQGSKRIFEALKEVIPQTQDIHFHIILGEKNLDMRSDFEHLTQVKLYNSLDQKRLGRLMKDIDIAITRGSSTLWELTSFGIHSIIIPLKATGGDHQTKNAEYFHEKYGSDIIDEDSDLKSELTKKLNSYKDLRKNWLMLEDFLDPVKKIVSEIEKSE